MAEAHSARAAARGEDEADDASKLPADTLTDEQHRAVEGGCSRNIPGPVVTVLRVKVPHAIVDRLRAAVEVRRHARRRPARAHREVFGNDSARLR